MKKIPFWKMSGSGNDFVVIDNRKKIIRGDLNRWAARFCFRQEGIGADGLLLLEPSKTSDFRMLYFNADGSRASMCGNGARCMAWFAHQNKVVGSSFVFDTDAYPVTAKVQRDRVKITLADARDYKPEVIATVDGHRYTAVFLNTGVPHAVIFVPDAAKVDIQTLGRALRFHPAFGPKGTNVNFVQKTGPDRLRVRTYERGVEGETLACGTGVTASAIAAVLKKKVKAPVRCETTGVDVLTVTLTPHFDNPTRADSQVTLEGPVRLTFRGEIHV